ncbi:MAG: phosphate/phosphite/phosphonate ABC transporter substrate-binding protein [Gammaproteobacteria bacterium]|nr:phosphate/phosphite/phosphonate ABC transporter substrate-binding protein [Gammaproteobacteria bacterium]
MIIKKIKLALIFIAFMFCISSLSSASENNNKTIRLGVAPFMTPMALIKRLRPLRDYLSEQLGMTVNIITARSGKEFMKRTLKGNYDFVFTNPFFALKALDTKQFDLIASQKKKITGHFVTLEDSSINSLKDLAGKKIGAPDKAGLLGKLINPFIKHSGFNKDNYPQVIHYDSHNSGVSALKIGDVDASLIVSFMTNHLREKGLKIKIIHKTEELPGMSIIVKKNSLDKKIVDSMKKAILRISNSPEGKSILKKIKMPAFKEANALELEPVRKYMVKH